jgi:Protein of unknown function (DUF1761)
MNDFFALMFIPFSHWEILVGGTLVFFVLGWIWYNPSTPVGKKWMEFNGFKTPKPEDMPKGKGMAVMLIFQLFMGFIVTHTVMTLWIFATNMGQSDFLATLFIIKMYMGFVFIKDLGHWYFEKKPFGLVLIGVGYYLVGILGICGLLSYWL